MSTPQEGGCKWLWWDMDVIRENDSSNALLCVHFIETIFCLLICFWIILPVKSSNFYIGFHRNQRRCAMKSRLLSKIDRVVTNAAMKKSIDDEIAKWANHFGFKSQHIHLNVALKPQWFMGFVPVLPQTPRQAESDLAGGQPLDPEWCPDSRHSTRYRDRLPAPYTVAPCYMLRILSIHIFVSVSRISLSFLAGPLHVEILNKKGEPACRIPSATQNAARKALSI